MAVRVLLYLAVVCLLVSRSSFFRFLYPFFSFGEVREVKKARGLGDVTILRTEISPLTVHLSGLSNEFTKREYGESFG